MKWEVLNSLGRGGEGEIKKTVDIIPIIIILNICSLACWPLSLMASARTVDIQDT